MYKRQHFTAARFLRKCSSKEVFKTICHCWINVYSGPPDFIHVDQGTNFISKEFKNAVSTLDIGLIEAPIECPNSLSHVERYHGPLRLVYEKLESQVLDASKDEHLQMAVSCMNNTMGPEGLCPTLCVFGVMPKQVRYTVSPTHLQRARAIDSAVRELEKIYAKRKLKFALKYRGPFGNE